MKIAAPYLLAILALILAGCGDESTSVKSTPPSKLTQEESAGLAVLTHFATNLINQENFPDLDPYEPSPEELIFRNILKDVCPNAMDAEVDFGQYGYSIGPQPMTLIAGEKTSHVNPRIVRRLNTPSVVRHCEIEYDYTTLDGESGSIPATYLLVERVIEGRKVHLIFSTKRTRQGADGDAEPSS